MDFLQHLVLGFGVASTLQNVLLVLLGCVLGTAIGALPGLGPLATIAMLLPLTYQLPAASALIALAGVYYGAQYGGSTTAILLNRAGESSSTITEVDGYQMARKGQAGQALAVAGFGSFIAGCAGTLLLAMVAAPLTEWALELGGPEYFSLIVLALVGAVLLSSGSLLKALAMTVMGLLLGSVGTDVDSAVVRFGMELPGVDKGLGFMLIAMGLFVFGQVVDRLGRREADRLDVPLPSARIQLSGQELRLMLPAVLRGTTLGALLGVLPGGGAVMAAFAAYNLERKTPLRAGETPFGEGNLRGVAAPESANNAGAQTSFIALMTLGIAPNAVMALLAGAMAMHNVLPSPAMLNYYPEVFWGLVASMWIGNVFLAVLNLPLVGIWTTLLRVPYRWLFPVMLLVCMLGIYATTETALHVWLLAAVGCVGYVFIALGVEPAPMLLGYVLGPLLEEYLRRSLLLSRGDWSVFLTRPASAALLATATLILMLVLLPTVKSKREAAFVVD